MNIQQEYRLQKWQLSAWMPFSVNVNELDAFERSIYDGKQHFIPLPAKKMAWY